MQSRAYSITLSILLLITLIAAMVFFIYGTAVWVVDAEFPFSEFSFGIGFGVAAAAITLALADRTFARRIVKPLFLAFILEYLLAFGTLGLGYISHALQSLALWLHAPAAFLISAVLPGGGRSTIQRDIGLMAVIEWLLIALLVILFQWYMKGRHASGKSA